MIWALAYLASLAIGAAVGVWLGLHDPLRYRRPQGQAMTLINRLLRRFGLLLVPTPPSAKMLHEHANVSETHHPSRGGNTVEWMRRVAGYMG